MDMATITRRAALGALGSLLGLGLSGTLALVPAEAKKHKKHKKHKTRRRRAGETPLPTPTDPGICPAGTFRVEDRCALSCDTGCIGGTCFSDIEGQDFCGLAIVSCNAIPQVCGNNAECGVQELCAQTLCGSPTTPPERRCVPLLS
jgi:hypothetical protein